MSGRVVVTLNDILKAKDRIKSCIHSTAVFTNSTFDARYGRKFYFKAENLQKTGSFKARGALNAVSRSRFLLFLLVDISFVVQ